MGFEHNKVGSEHCIGQNNPQSTGLIRDGQQGVQDSAWGASTPISTEGAPTRIGPTSSRRHITGTTAINLPYARMSQSGGWHTGSTWFSPVPLKLHELNYTNETTYSVLLDRLGKSGLRDARWGLRTIGHPDGWKTTKIWAATHDRAVIEIAWEGIMLERKRRREGFAPPIDALELARWLPYPHQWIRLHWWAWRLRWSLTGKERHKWDRWRKEWSPWPT